MTYPPYTNDRRTTNQGQVLGCFDNSEYDTFFEYANRTEFDGDWAEDHPHIIFMSDGSVRYATIKKTVAYVVIDEAIDGNPITEHWAIKRHRQY